MNQTEVRQCLIKYIEKIIEIEKTHNRGSKEKLTKELKVILTDLSPAIKNDGKVEFYWFNKLDRLIKTEPLSTSELDGLLKEIRKHIFGSRGESSQHLNIDLKPLKDEMAVIQGQQDRDEPGTFFTLRRQSESGEYWIVGTNAGEDIVGGCRIEASWLRCSGNINEITITDSHNDYLEAVKDRLIIVD